jgi:hypothetical protein
MWFIDKDYISLIRGLLEVDIYELFWMCLWGLSFSFPFIYKLNDNYFLLDI